jgi:hypothetical protein
MHRRSRDDDHPTDAQLIASLRHYFGEAVPRRGPQPSGCDADFLVAVGSIFLTADVPEWR